MNTQQLVFVIDGEKEVYKERHGFEHLYTLSQDVIKEFGIKAERNKTRELQVDIYELYISKGKLERKLIQSYKILAPYVQMTAKEFNEEESKLLKDIDSEFRGWISKKAWDEAYSNEEVIENIKSLVEDLKPLIKNVVDKSYDKGWNDRM